MQVVKHKADILMDLDAKCDALIKTEIFMT